MNTQQTTTAESVSSTPLCAFVVSAEDTASVIAFAPDRTDAKRIARRSEWLEDCEWIDLRVRREPQLDALAAKRGRGIMDGSAKDDARIMRNLGWYEMEGASDYCEGCGLHQWECLSESYVAEAGDAFLCRECRDALASEANVKADSSAVAD